MLVNSKALFLTKIYLRLFFLNVCPIRLIFVCSMKSALLIMFEQRT